MLCCESPLRHIAGRSAALMERSGYRHTRRGLKNAWPLSTTESFANRSRKLVAWPCAYALLPVRAKFGTRASETPHARMRRSMTIAFTGLPHDVDEEEVKGVFSRCGKVAHVGLRVQHRMLAAASGWVRFTSQESVDRALALHNTEIIRRRMLVYALFELPDTVEVGRLPLGIDNDRVKALFASCGNITDIKIHYTITGRQTGQSYGFIRFASPSSVPKAIELNRSTFAGRTLSVRRALQTTEDVSIWNDYAETSEMTDRSVHIYGLPPQVNDDRLKSEFEDCGEIVVARVWRALSTGRSLGFGVVEFASPESAEKALIASKKIDGHLLRTTRVPPLRPRMLDRLSIPAEENTTSIFVGRLTENVDEAWLQREFERYGRVVRANVLRHSDSGKSRGVGFVTFSSLESAELALQQNLRLTIDGFTVKIARKGTLSKPRRDLVVPPDANNASDGLDGSSSWEQDY
ncbi:RNA-binding domain-containing protein [Peniophora sp. CONT]|nr:RNA-binding domain-containing protein [Peniophora sp. CONT]